MFKRVFLLLLAAFLLPNVLLAADDPFIGQWKLNASKSNIVDVMKVGSLGENKYAFSDNGSGPETIVADGRTSPASPAQLSLSPSRDPTPGRWSARGTAACS